MVTRFTFLIDGRPVYAGLTAAEIDALVRTARRFPHSDPNVNSGCRIDTKKES